MTGPAPQINFFLPLKTLRALRDGGRHKFFSIAHSAFTDLGCPVELHQASQDALAKSHLLPGYSLLDTKNSHHDRALDVRPLGIGPFYRIERQQDRAAHYMTGLGFDPARIDRQKARSFFKIWERLGTRMPPDPPFRGHVLVALQGRLTRHRRFQSMSPIDMIKTTLAHDAQRQIVLKLHPKETYSDRERSALAALLQSPRIHLWEGDLDDVLAHCAYVVTQNSSVLLKGVFYRKAAVIFADCEYHHAFLSLRRGLTPDQAFSRVTAAPSDFEAFAYWYLQLNSINTSREWAAAQILDHCRRFGWKI